MKNRDRWQSRQRHQDEVKEKNPKKKTEIIRNHKVEPEQTKEEWRKQRAEGDWEREGEKEEEKKRLVESKEWAVTRFTSSAWNRIQFHTENRQSTRFSFISLIESNFLTDYCC